MDKLGSESSCSRPGLGLSSVLDDIVERINFLEQSAAYATPGEELKPDMPCVILTTVCSDMQEEEFERYFFGPLLLPLFLENCVDKSVHQG